ncbi:MAG TPA: hypothetical protein VMS22_02710 [Candidatus Eisenbacteria bacterium]|nr:hypothetical protein [Candidatus Eisenbacteria bacterium]
MRLVLALLAALLALPHAASAGMNRNYLVPSYVACPGSGNCNPPTLASAYTFDTIILMTPQQRYTGPGKLALSVVIKGLKDPSGNLFTGTIKMSSGTTRVTILSQGVGTLGETSPLAIQPPYSIQVKNGAARFRYNTPDAAPEHGLIAESVSSPVVLDPDGKPLATTGSQSKP